MTAMAVSTGVRAVRHGCALRADAVTTFKIQKRSERNTSTTINDTKKYSGTSILYKSVELARDSLR